MAEEVERDAMEDRFAAVEKEMPGDSAPDNGLEEAAVGGGAAGGEGAAPAKAALETRPADFSELQGSGSEALADMDMILDIPVTVSVELGRAEMFIRDILQLGKGSVVELEKLAGEPMEILVNGRLVARGEVVMVDEKFGVRLTDIVSPTERVKRLA